MDMADAETPAVHITFVHGTWGRGFLPKLWGPMGIFSSLRRPFLRRSSETAKRTFFWFEDRSSFTKTLKHRLTALGVRSTTKSYNWSGANSIIARADAAKGLATLLRESRKTYPDAKQIIIAHSHGGNVVRRALDHLPTPHDIFVVTMATPFVEIDRSEYFTKESDLWRIINPFIRPASPLEKLLGTVRTMLIVSTGVLALLIDHLVSPVVFILLYPLVSLLFLILMTYYLVGNSLSTENIVAATRGGRNWPNNVPLYIVRVLRDEASLSLAAADIGNELSLRCARLMVWMNDILRPRGMIATMRNTAVFIAAAVVLLLQGSVSYLIALMILPFVPGIVTVLCVLAANAFRSVDGRELFTGSLMCGVITRDKPDSGNIIFPKPIDPERQTGLRHSIYNNERCPVVIADAIKEYAFQKHGEAQPSIYLRSAAL